MALTNKLTAIGDAIRAKTGKSDLLTLDQMPLEIEGIMDGQPIEVDSLDDISLSPDKAGKVYKCEDKLYQVNKVTSLKGLTIKFNEHITPCPVIGEDDVFECSGMLMTIHTFVISPNRIISTLSKKAITDSYLTEGVTSIVFTVGASADVDNDGDYGYDTYYAPSDNAEGAGWYQFCNSMGNESTTFYSFVITDFDCPVLNENPEFIEWIFANAKVYTKIETLNDIEGFELNIQTGEDYSILEYACGEAGFEMLGDYIVDGITGQFTASFQVNGEVVTKTFTKFVDRREGDVRFYNGDNDLLVFDYNAIFKYNDVVIDGSVTFTTFDCILNDSYYFLSYVLTYSELIDMEYVNGCYFVEYVEDPILQEKTATENGEVLPDEGYDGLSKVIVAVESSGGGETIEEYDGTVIVT